MSYLQAVVLGIIQGLTEFLPISSSAHLRFISSICGWSDPGAAFSAITQIGTETAVLIFFRKDILALVNGFLRKPKSKERKLATHIIIGSIPIVIFGFLLKDVIESNFRSGILISSSMLVFSFVFAYADKKSQGNRSIESLTHREALVFGFAQSAAIIPGVSRSGGTISAGLLLGFTRVQSARFSFLLAIPAVLGSGLFELRKLNTESTAWPQTVAATFIAFFVGYAVIRWFLNFISTNSFMVFVKYRIVISSIFLILFLCGIIK